MGRTALVRHVSERMRAEARFFLVDFSQRPAEACRRLVLSLFPHMSGGAKNLHFGRTRFALVTRPLPSDRRLVVVLDDITKMSHAKLDLLRRLSGADRFQILAVAERFLLERELLRMRSILQAGPPVVLVRLSIEETERYFAEASERHDLRWNAG